MKSREIRRKQLEKQKKKAKKFFREIWQDEEFANDNSRVGKRAKTRVPCSCWMCGNPRHHHFKKKDQLTLQEKKFHETEEHS
jgi:hypothetical protein